MHKIAGMFLACLACASLPCHAQVYKWVDKDGKVQYSDKAPPDGAGTSPAQKLDTPTPSNSPGSGKGTSWQEKEREFNRRRIESAEKQAKEGERDRRNQQRCNDARRYLRKLQEGSVVYTTDDKGEKQYMSDAEHQAEIARVQSLVSENCR